MPSPPGSVPSAPDFAALLDGLPDPLLVVDARWRLTYTNRGAAALAGSTPTELRGRELWDGLPAARESELEDHLRRVMATRGGVEAELFSRGLGAWLAVRATPHGDGVAVHLRNVTGRRLGEELLAVTHALAAASGVEEVARAALTRALPALGAVAGAVLRQGGDAGRLEVVHTQGEDLPLVRAWARLGPGTPLPVADALRGGEAVFLGEREMQECAPALHADRDGRPRAAAVLPLRVDGRAVGALALGFDTDRSWGAPERDFATSLAGQLAQALERARAQGEREQTLLLLERERARLSAVLGGLPVGVWVAEVPGGRLLAGNAASERLLRQAFLPSDDIAGYRGYVGFHADGRRYEEHEWPLARTVTTGERVEGEEVEMERGDGTRGVVSLSSTLIPGGSGGPGLAVVTGIDVTARRRAEAAVLEREAHQRALLDGLAPVVWSSTAGGTVERFNRRWHDLTGLPTQPRGPDWLEAVHPEDRAAALAAREAGLATGTAYTTELRFRTRDGAYRWHLVQVAPLEGGPGAAPRGWVGSATDIHDRRLTEEAARRAQEDLARSEERFRALIEVTAQFAWTNSPEGEMRGDQPGWARLTGQSPGEYQGYGWSERVHPEDRGPTLRAWEHAVATRSRFEVEHRVLTAQGGHRYFLVRSVPLLDAHGAVREWVGLHTDIHERKRAELMLQAWGGELERQVARRTEELQAANAELEAFSYSVSHDLRAPLRHVIGFAALLRRKAAARLGPGEARYLDLIETSAGRMNTLIDDLLRLAQVSRQELRLEDVDLGALVAELRRDLEPETRPRQVGWVVGELPTVRGDPGLLRQVLANLLSNALKYTGGREWARVEVGSEERPGEVVVFVRDNGAGFDEAYAGRLFGVFQRLHRAEEFEGTGIGLVNVRRIVTRHGGRVWAQGRVGEGATFFFSLPGEGPQASAASPA